MPGPNAQNDYGSFGGVPNEKPSETGGATPFSVHAAGADFGSQVGEAKQGFGAEIQKTGAEASDLSLKYGQMATEAKANDAIVNQWAPQAEKLKEGYEQLSPQDKIIGYDKYIGQLQQGATNFVGQSGSPYETLLRSQWTQRHIANEIDSAGRDHIQAINEFEGTSNAKMLLLQQRQAADNYDDPNVVSQSKELIQGQAEKMAMDQGADPNDPAQKLIVDMQKKQAWGDASVQMINAAVKNGDTDKAQQLYHDNRQDIPGHDQVAIDKTIIVMSAKQSGHASANAIVAGMPIPDMIGTSPVNVKISVVKAAESDGTVDPNIALTVARIESGYGQNVGKRGDIGQTGKLGDIETQSANMVSSLKTAKGDADKATGGASEPWQQYLCYQQGSGGGPALIKASTDNPNARAVDVLKPLYSTPQKALQAITNNGGDPTMTSGQFMEFIKEKYQINANAAKCEVPGTIIGQPAYNKLSDAMIAQHSVSGPTLQKGSNPIEDLANFDKQYIGAINNANQIVNPMHREETIKALNNFRSVYSNKAEAYQTQIRTQLNDIIKDPKFTDVASLPPDLATNLSIQQMNYATKVAESNMAKSAGVSTEEQKHYGSGVYEIDQSIRKNKIRSPDELQDYLPGSGVPDKEGKLTLAGVHELEGRFTKDVASDMSVKQKQMAIEAVTPLLTGEHNMYNWVDPLGKARVAQAWGPLNKAYDEGLKNDVPISELTDPSSPKWIGNSVKGLIRSPEQIAMDMTHYYASAGSQNPNAITPKVENSPAYQAQAETLYKQYKAEGDPAKKTELYQRMQKLMPMKAAETPAYKPEAPISK